MQDRLSTTANAPIILVTSALHMRLRYFNHVNVWPCTPAAAEKLQALRDQRVRIGTQSWCNDVQAVARRSREVGAASIRTDWADVESGVPQRKMARS